MTIPIIIPIHDPEPTYETNAFYIDNEGVQYSFLGRTNTQQLEYWKRNNLQDKIYKHHLLTFTIVATTFGLLTAFVMHKYGIPWLSGSDDEPKHHYNQYDANDWFITILPILIAMLPAAMVVTLTIGSAVEGKSIRLNTPNIAYQAFIALSNIPASQQTGHDYPYELFLALKNYSETGNDFDKLEALCNEILNKAHR